MPKAVSNLLRSAVGRATRPFRSRPGDSGDEDKPHACGHCPTRFKKRSDLARHEKIHLSREERDIISFKCDAPGCSASFLQKSGLRSHQRTHTGERLSCPECEFKTSDNGSLSRHRKNLHGHARKAGGRSRTSSSSTSDHTSFSTSTSSMLPEIQLPEVPVVPSTPAASLMSSSSEPVIVERPPTAPTPEVPAVSSTPPLFLAPSALEPPIANQPPPAVTDALPTTPELSESPADGAYASTGASFETYHHFQAYNFPHQHTLEFVPSLPIFANDRPPSEMPTEPLVYGTSGTSSPSLQTPVLTPEDETWDAIPDQKQLTGCEGHLNTWSGDLSPVNLPSLLNLPINVHSDVVSAHSPCTPTVKVASTPPFDDGSATPVAAPFCGSNHTANPEFISQGSDVPYPADSTSTPSQLGGTAPLTRNSLASALSYETSSPSTPKGSLPQQNAMYNNPDVAMNSALPNSYSHDPQLLRLDGKPISPEISANPVNSFTYWPENLSPFLMSKERAGNATPVSNMGPPGFAHTYPTNLPMFGPKPPSWPSDVAPSATNLAFAPLAQAEQTLLRPPRDPVPKLHEAMPKAVHALPRHHQRHPNPIPNTGYSQLGPIRTDSHQTKSAPYVLPRGRKASGPGAKPPSLEELLIAAAAETAARNADEAAQWLESLPREEQTRIMRKFSLSNLPRSDLLDFLQTMGAFYFRHPPRLEPL